MTTITLDRKELEKRIGKITPEIESKIIMMGVEIDDINEEEVIFDITPNRPDLLSLQGFSRSFLQYLGKKGIANFKINKPEKNYKVKVDKSVKSVRPYTVCAIVKGLKLNDEKIKEIIDIQEKLHLTIGRKRKKLAIGIYPLEKIKLPIKYEARKPDYIKFIPLEMNKELTGRQILRQHPAGRDYAFLLQDADKFPIFTDADGKILSMPPIINSDETGKINEKTRDVFIECSGFNLAYLKKTLNIIISIFYDMGGKIYAMNIIDEKSFISPDFEKEKMRFNIEDINKTLGLKLAEKEIKKYLGRMGIDYGKDKQGCFALIPPYRTDILHWVDLIEEVAIAYGYENFKPEIPEISTIGEEEPKAKLKRVISDILAGLGLLECSSYHLTTKRDIKKMNYDFKNFIEVEDSKTEYSVLRNDLLSNLLKIFSENSDSSYPQKIFEIGKVFELNSEKETGIGESDKIAVALADENISFTDIKQILDYLFRMMGKEYKIEEVEHVGFITGRVGKIIVNEKEAGFMGEIAPRVLRNWKMKMPVSAFEIDLNILR